MESVLAFSLFTDYDILLFKQGRHFRLYEKLGSHVVSHQGRQGVYFAVWAPAARAVSVIGSFNGWNREAHVLSVRWDESGIWEGFIPGARKGDLYKYAIRTASGEVLEKGDPFARYWEVPPRTASIVWEGAYDWEDVEWMQQRRPVQKDGPVSIYELHMGSWQKRPDDPNRSLSYREMADALIPYIQETGFTHVEFLPLMQHPFYGSWGYQITGYFAPDSRYGPPEDFQYLIDRLHRAGIGVILDWVPSHFPGDAHGLYHFDGSHLYEHEDPRRGYHPDWTSYIFNYGRHEVRSFLISNALFWLDRYHADGLRVDAVASMLYLDYSRKEGEWLPNIHGGNENLEAVAFLQELNTAVRAHEPHALTIAEESTSWPGVTARVEDGGLGFDRKWMMGWMHDSLRFFKRPTVYRGHHLGELTFSMLYFYSEKFVLPLSHDEVVHGKSSLLGRMPGDEWQRFANLRLLYGYMFMHPGDKLLFMGSELGQVGEWSPDAGVEWHWLDRPLHRGVRRWVERLNALLRAHPALWQDQFDPHSFQWVSTDDTTNSVLAFLRSHEEEILLVVCNFSPNTVASYELGVPVAGDWEELACSDDKTFGGSGIVQTGTLKAVPEPMHGLPCRLTIRLAPLAVMIFRNAGGLNKA